MVKRKLLIGLILACTLGLGIGFSVGPMVVRLFGSHPGSAMLWESSATTVAEQAKEADLVVRVRAESVKEPRVLTFGNKEQTEEIAQIEANKVRGIPFTDTQMRVLEVYKGAVSVGETITVLQTGGPLPATESFSATNVELHDDPIFVAGSEYILFLRDISGDKIHAPDRKLYRVTNPAGRYDIQGETVTSYADLGGRKGIPTRLGPLLDEIKKVTHTK